MDLSDYQREEKRFEELQQFIDNHDGKHLSVAVIVRDTDGVKGSINLLSISPKKAEEMLEDELNMSKLAYKKALQDRIAEIEPENS